MFLSRNLRARALSGAAAIGLVAAGMGACTSSAGPTDACVGEWDLVSMSAEGESVGAAELEQFEEMGLRIFLLVEEDGTAILSFFGEDEKGTWVGTSGGCTLTMSNEKIDAQVTDGLLSIEQDGAEITFSKTE